MVMERKIIYLINPISGTSKKEGIKRLIELETTTRGIPFEILPTIENGDYDWLTDKIIAEKVTDIVIIGGDGTVNQVTNALRHLPVQFGIMPLGSGNGLALTAGIPRNAKEALTVIFSGTAKPVDVFFVNRYYSCMLSGMGFDAEVARSFAAKSARGLFTYTQESLINFFKAHPYQFEVILDDFSFYTDAFAISIANSNQFGNNVTIAPQADLNDGLLDIVIIQKMSKSKLPFALLKQIRGNNHLEELVNNMTKKNVLYFQTPSLKIHNLKLAPLHIDGEPMETAEEFTIQVIKNGFKLIQP
jgi:YegS/Rv2252/BmrU family lipid kinase